jgi:hypothetical protein
LEDDFLSGFFLSLSFDDEAGATFFLLSDGLLAAKKLRMSILAGLTAI